MPCAAPGWLNGTNRALASRQVASASTALGFLPPRRFRQAVRLLGQSWEFPVFTAYRADPADDPP